MEKCYKPYCNKFSLLIEYGCKEHRWENSIDKSKCIEYYDPDFIIYNNYTVLYTSELVKLFQSAIPSVNIIKFIIYKKTGIETLHLLDSYEGLNFDGEVNNNKPFYFVYKSFYQEDASIYFVKDSNIICHGSLLEEVLDKLKEITKVENFNISSFDAKNIIEFFKEIGFELTAENLLALLLKEKSTFNDSEEENTGILALFDVIMEDINRINYLKHFYRKYIRINTNYQVFTKYDLTTSNTLSMFTLCIYYFQETTILKIDIDRYFISGISFEETTYSVRDADNFQEKEIGKDLIYIKCIWILWKKNMNYTEENIKELSTKLQEALDNYKEGTDIGISLKNIFTD